MNARLRTLSHTKWLISAISVAVICSAGVYTWSYSQSMRRDPKVIQTPTKETKKKLEEACKPNCTTSSTTSLPSAQTYIALGIISLRGLQVGATFYGAIESPVNGHYILSNLLQGGVKNGGDYDGYDDNGEGACGGKFTNLADQATWAENDNGTILGELPCGTKLEISYHNHTIVAEKSDTSNGGCTAPQTRCSDNGQMRMIDLWWQTAKALCFTDQPDVMTIHVVPTSTPTTIIPSYNPKNAQSTTTCQ